MSLVVPAYAKLNLTLDVLGRRPNGYHDIDSVMQTISLHDLVSIDRSDCRVFDVVGPPIEGENLILKAARELEGRTSRQLPFSIRLYKRIPIGGGLGGGSADAAAFLKAANVLYALNLNMAELAEVASELGQDVAFFLHGGTVRATGLGSTLSALRSMPASWRFLVVAPPIAVSTRSVYEAVGKDAASARHTPRLVAALAAAQGGRELFGNDLEQVTRQTVPPFAHALDQLRTVVPSLTMSGTGSAVFAVFDGVSEAAAALKKVRDLGFPAWICRPVAASH